MRDIDNNQDVLDIRDIIERVEELQDDDKRNADDNDELASLNALLNDCRGNGGDHQYNGDWYPVTLIRDTHFVDSVQEMLEDCGDISKDLPAYVHIDWERTANDVQMDYTSVDFDGVDYWYR